MAQSMVLVSPLKSAIVAGMRAAKHQNWILAGFLAGSALLATRYGGKSATPCSGGLCNLEALAATCVFEQTNSVQLIHVETDK